VSASQAPTWSVTDLYSGLGAPEFQSDFEQLMRFGDALADVLDTNGVRGIEPRAATAADAAVAEQVVQVLNAANELGRTLWAFVEAHSRVDSTDDIAIGLGARIGTLIGRNRGLNARFAAWLAALDVDALASMSVVVTQHHGPLARLAARARHQMSEAEETLAAELSASASMAWTQLHATATSQMTVEVELPDGTRRMPMAAIRGLGTHGDERVRRAAFEAELRGWPTVAPVCAAALNAIKGEANVVNRRRGWAEPLDASLFGNVVTRDEYDAMTQAVVASLPDFQRFVRAKARVHGHGDSLPWWDLVAPMPGAPVEWEWEAGLQMVRDAFGTYGGGLAGIVDRAVRERWIDALPRPGKAPGASSMPFFGDRSLVFLNWTGALEQVFTTAHELGHSYHNMQLARRTAMQRDVPMSLAETASIFCETLMVHVGLERTSGADRLEMLDLDLCGHTQTVVDIHTRVLFETEVFARRARRTLGAGELGEIMTQAQAIAFGDSLRSDTCHPFMWAVKRHYYTSNFYNWQYTFGLLFGLGLFSRYLADPEGFRAEYDDMLSRAGMDTAAELATRFHIDLADPAFWTSSLDIIRRRIDQYEVLTAG
jgi:pepF/M3 family oligoendopeptidase